MSSARRSQVRIASLQADTFLLAPVLHVEMGPARQGWMDRRLRKAAELDRYSQKVIIEDVRNWGFKVGVSSQPWRCSR
ncbi:hypothetical protein BAUCODRAFT_123487 [Baudoinia panamericana UAMH 10762]|uniref:Uncharacterized protein n=1 Tax=Baudoinia panamericana (strain UAMH 10762) TaxID=717646 RepID=M2MEL6_BAUPA|nr:uncharacterized protein BAUCODRAFT_123487 [Baudoinia panamericana UAMH 10762]EMC95001.1 hypothetical protein BAUCODRAFT_123487 [Baudoinia panamericana UAMH 10762]